MGTGERSARGGPPDRPTTRQGVERGVMLALAAATISGVSVWMNARIVAEVAVFGDPGTWTTAKNLVAAVVVAGIGVLAARRWGGALAMSVPTERRALVALVVVSVVGGSVPFLLFFEGLAASGSPLGAQAVHKSSLLVFVCVLGPVVLRERLGALQAAGVGLVVIGYLLGGGALADMGARGVLLVMAAAALWAIETVIDRWLLAEVTVGTVAVARLGVGTLWLLAIGLLTGDTARLADLGTAGWAWALLAGAVLSAYVLCWLGALALAQAVDVTALLALAVPITALVQRLVDGATPATPGALVAIVAGVVVVGVAATRPRAGFGSEWVS